MWDFCDHHTIIMGLLSPITDLIGKNCLVIHLILGSFGSPQNCLNHPTHWMRMNHLFMLFHRFIFEL
jgi:hypothetical protein